jgi:hypothetical protein
MKVNARETAHHTASEKELSKSTAAYGGSCMGRMGSSRLHVKMIKGN